MSVVALPEDLFDSLAPSLRARGLIATTAGRGAVVVSAVAPPAPARWIALAVDAGAAAIALDSGADDVILPGTDPVLAIARIARVAQPALLRAGPLAIDRLARTVTRDSRPLCLLPREYAVLLHLAQHADRLVTRPQLRAAVWGRDFDPGTNVIEVHISRVRAALDRDALPMLLTERGRGYRLVSNPDVAERRHAS